MARKVGYYAASRMLAASYVFVAPMVALYELGVTLDPYARSGADFVLGDLFDRFSHLGLVFLNLVLLAFLFLAIWHTKARRIRVPGLYWYMLLESTLWACVLLAVGRLIPPSSFPATPLALPAMGQQVVGSIGAGVYEETIFRLLLMGGIIFVLQTLLGGHPAWVVPVAVGASALLFSLAHHNIGGEAWNRQVFLFRTMMGGLLGALFWFRGLGIVVWVHALYNIALAATHA